MPDFSEFADDAKKFAGEHPQQTDEAMQKAGDFANQETGNRYGDQIQKGEQAAENYMGGQGGQNQGDQSQDGQYGDQNQGGQYDQSQGGQYGDQNQGDQGGQY
jgi:MT0933-like antitoxin protein